jgi:hypothetical protein
MFEVHDEATIMGLRAQLSAAVSALDLGSCLPSAAERLVIEGDQIERLGRAIKTLAATKVAETGTWQRDGARSAEDWLANKTGTSKSDAADTLSTGHKIKDLPATADALRKGKLSSKQAKAVADAAAADPSAEDDLLDTAQNDSLGALKDKARRTKAAADNDPEATRRRIHARRSCRHWTDSDGIGHLHASGPADVIGRMAARIAHQASKTFDQARKDGRREPLDAYAFDALDQLIHQDGRGTGMPVGADAKIIVRIDHSALMRGWVADGETCEIAGIGPVAVSVVRQWMNDAFIAAILTKGEEITRVVHLGRRFTAKQKTALQWRDPECCVKGCTNTLRLEYDHDTGWANTHTSEVDDADRLCPGDHKKKTAGWHLADPDPNGKRPLLPPNHPDHPFQIAARRARSARAPAQTA